MMSREKSDRGRRPIRYQGLFIALLLAVAAPSVLPERTEGLLLPLLFTIVALAALAAAARRPRILIVGLVLAVPSLLASWVEPTEPTWTVAGAVLQMLFLGWVVTVVIHHVTRATRVSSDILFGVACAYLLLGLFWGIGYGIAETVEPGAIALPTDAETTADLHSLSGERIRLYFSFVTLTTLGYGDVRPASDTARIMAMLEGMLGQLFLVILVARLVGLHTVQLTKGSGAASGSADFRAVDSEPL